MLETSLRGPCEGPEHSGREDAELAPQLSDVDVLEYAVDAGWIELAPSGQSVRVTAKGARTVNGT